MNAKVILTAALSLVPSSVWAQEYLVVPSSLRDAEERITVRFGIGITPTFSGVEPGPNSDLALGADQLRNGNTMLEGNLAFGTRRVLLPTLNTFVLMQGLSDLRGLPTVAAPGALLGNEQPSIHPSVAHSFGGAGAFLFHLGYAELDGLTRDGLLSGFKLRAGRQFHWGVAPVTFDGANLGFDYQGFSVHLRGGQRSAIYDRRIDDFEAQSRGLLLGGNVGYDYERGDFRLAVGAEFLHFQRTLGLIAAEATVLGQDSVLLESNLAELSVTVQPMSGLDLTARAQMALPDLTRLELEANLELGRTLLILEFTQRVGRDIFYDLAGGRGFSRENRERTYESQRLNIPNFRPYSQLEASLLFDVTSWLEVGPSVGGRLVYADPAERTPFDTNRLDLGFLAQSRFSVSEQGGLEVFAEYLGILYDRAADEQTGVFDDLSMGGETMVHDLYLSVRYVRGDRSTAGRLLTGQRLSTGLYGYLTLALLDNRYVEEEATEASGGAGIDARVGLTRYVEARVAYEFVRDSNILFSELGGFHMVRTSLEGRF